MPIIEYVCPECGVRQELLLSRKQRQEFEALPFNCSSTPAEDPVVGVKVPCKGKMFSLISRSTFVMHAI